MIAKLMTAAAAAAFLLAAGAAQAAPEGMLGRIATKGSITFAVRDDAPPFAFKGEDGKPAGLSVELCHLIANELATQLNLTQIGIATVPVTPATRFDTIVAGRADIECGISTITFTRRERVDFSIPFFATGTAIATPTGSGVEGIADLEGKTIAVPTGTTTETNLKRTLAAERVNATVLPVEKVTDAFAAVKNGKAEALASDRMVLIGLDAETRAAGLMLLPGILSFEPYALVLPRNEADFRLAIDRAIIGLYQDGVLDQLYEKWLAPLGAEPGPMLDRMLQLQAVPE